MKKCTLILLFGLLVVTLSGCGKKPADTPGYEIDPNITGTIGDVVPGTTAPVPENTGFKKPSPTPTDTITPTPTPEGNYVGFSLESGFYTGNQEVTLYCNEEGAKIYYTLDGKTPDNTCSLYEGPLTITNRTNAPNVLSAQTGISPGNTYVPNFSVDKGTVVRAIAYLPDGTTTPVFHATYFVGLDRAKYVNVPVVSLITDFDNLFDYETGIYTLGKTYDDFVSDPINAALEAWQMQGNYTNRGREWERPVSVELITADETPGFKQNMGMRIMGASTRNQAQKSIRIYAREEYGKKNLKYELIPGNLRSDGTDILRKYKSFVLRIGGNDADFGRLRDPFLQNLVQGAHFDTQQNTPCVVFINGEYWGMYTINEDYTDNHFENNYGIDNKNIVLVKCGELEEGEDADLALFHDMYLFITQNDMSDPEQYKAACELVDMESFIDYFAFQLYIHNEDSIFENNNWRIWRVRNADKATEWSDGKWRFALYDNDFSTGIYSGSDNAAYDNISPIIAPSSAEERTENIKNFVPLELFRSLVSSSEFRNDLVLALCDMRNIYFEPELASRVLTELAEPYLALMPDTFKRFGPDWIAYQDTALYYESKVNELRNYITKRYNAMPNLIKDAFGLGPMKKLNLSTGDTGLGTVQINGRTVDLGCSFGGMYFPETTVTLTAVPAEGCKFVRWDVTNGELADTTSQTIRFTMEAGVTVNAVFERN